MNLPEATSIRRISRALALTVGLGLLACGEATAPSSLNLSVVPLKAEYTPGETVYVRAENNRSDPIGFESCHAILERRIGMTWLPVPGPGLSCVDTIRASTAPGESRTGPAAIIPDGAPVGTYRVKLVGVYLLPGGQGPHPVASASFKVVVP